MPWHDALPFAEIPAHMRRRARKHARSFPSAEEAVASWPRWDRWMLPVLGLPHGIVDVDVLRTWLAENRPTRTRTRIERWATEAGVDDLLDQAAWRLGSHVRFYGVVFEGLMARHDWQREPLLKELERLALRRHQAELRIATNRARWEAGPAFPILKDVHTVTRKHFDELLKRRTPTSAFRLDNFSSEEDLSITAEDGSYLTLEPVQLYAATIDGVATLLDILCDAEAIEAFATYASLPAWSRDLADLDRDLSSPPGPDDDKKLLGWLLRLPSGHLDPIRARPKKRGNGLVYRRIDPDDVTPDLCTEPQDQRLTDLLRRRLPIDALFPLLEDHPRLVVEGVDGLTRGTPVSLRRATVAIGILDHDDQAELTVTLGEHPATDEHTHTVEQALFRVDGTTASFGIPGPTERAILRRVRQRPIRVPHEEVGVLLERLPGWSERAAIRADEGVLGPSLEPDRRPVVRLALDTDGLHVQVRVQPLPELPSMPPGEGSEVLAALRDGEPVHLRRDLEAEVHDVERALQRLHLPEHGRHGFQWDLADMQEVLAVVDAAGKADEQLRVRWSGERPTVHEQATTRDLSLRVAKSRNWFGIEGGARVGKAEVPLKELIQAASEGHAYVPLSKGQWVGLSDGLRAHLKTLQLTGGGRGGKVELSALHAGLLEPLVDEGAELDAPPDWFSITTRLREAADLQVDLPDGLEATLRDYQVLGVQWLLRMAHWAPGAVLADDMGLGKTLQTIALLLARADGPALVVAPTSLLFNWRSELQRFAPSLNVRLYWGQGRSLGDPAPGEILLTTYGTLQRDGEVLQAVRFRTVVLDEAQAIKNPDAQRSRAACTLETDFRLALSGTPVENRTDELWSLFRFVAPGLLGPRQRFQSVFVGPIEQHDDHTVRKNLARLVGPFVLRRTKRQVARELPERTEIVRRVEHTPAERALYDRVRLECIERLQSGRGHGLQAATELLKLRKLACHPRLYDSGSPLKSSKLHAVLRTVHDLVDSGHQALIFSQFTTHLGLVREALEDDGFRVAYLDGSLSPTQRQAQVDVFQAGQADVFLISLKAGGTGLNLTAATYVLHLDPWWNPAAEDQATDRAHRIGQTRAVTVIRFVTAGTVEEQIVEMHASKRELAESLLSGGATSDRLTPDVVLGLLTASLDDVASTTEEDPQPPPFEVLTEAPAPRPEPPLEAAPPEPSEDLLERFRTHLIEEGRKKPTARSYTNAIRNLLTTLPGPPDRDTVAAHGPDYVAKAKAGAGLSKSDKVYASPAFRAFLAFLDGLTPTEHAPAGAPALRR